MLTVRDHAVIRFADRRYAKPGARVEAIRHELGMTETRYAQVLNTLLDDADAEREYATLVRRLRRVRDGRRAQRAA